MKIYTDTPEGVTVVQNSFIDLFMPRANGEFVKVYLYLLRCANTGRDVSLSSIADVMEHTEKDVRRALSYWEKQDLIHLKTNAQGELLTITFSDLPSAPEEGNPEAEPDDSRRPTAGAAAWRHSANPQGKTWEGTEPVPGDSWQQNGTIQGGPRQEAGKQQDPLQEKVPPAQREGNGDAPSRERVAALSQQKEIRQLFFIAEQYFQRPLTSGEQSDLVYYYDALHFSSDLIEYLLEYCISKGSASRHYMKKVALSWAEAGITTVLQAKQETTLYNRNYYTVFKAFGIKGRSPAQAEMETMSRWFTEFDFSIDIVLEACNRTIRQTHQPSFEYANRILKDWHESGVSSLEDVKQLDQQRTQNRQRRESPKSLAPQKSQNNRFNNFSQREYNYSQLEKQLLQ